MENNKHQSRNGSNGFILGVIVGVALTLLFVTKRGRKILKAITEEGQGKITDLEEMLKEKKAQAKLSIEDLVSVAEDPDIVAGDDYIDTNGLQDKKPTSPQLKKATHHPHRFFRKSTKN